MENINAAKTTYRTGPLGYILGSLRYFGACSGCGKQFLSTHEVVHTNGTRTICSRCKTGGK